VTHPAKVKCGFHDIQPIGMRSIIDTGNKISGIVRRTQLGQIKYCQLYRMNYENIRPDIGSTSETCVSQVLGSYIASGCQAYFNVKACPAVLEVFAKRRN